MNTPDEKKENVVENVAEKELRVLAKLPQEIQGLDKKVYQLKPLSLRKEIQLYKLFSEFSKNLPIDPSTGQMDAMKAFNALTEMPVFCSKAASVAFDISEEELLDNFDLDQIQEILDPFFEKYFGLRMKDLTLGETTKEQAPLPTSLASSVTPVSGPSIKSSNTPEKS